MRELILMKINCAIYFDRTHVRSYLRSVNKSYAVESSSFIFHFSFTGKKEKQTKYFFAKKIERKTMILISSVHISFSHEKGYTCDLLIKNA